MFPIFAVTKSKLTQGDCPAVSQNKKANYETEISFINDGLPNTWNDDTSLRRTTEPRTIL